VGDSSARSLIDLDRGVHVVYSRERELRRCTLMAGHYDPGGVHAVRRRCKGTRCPFVLWCTGWLHYAHRSLDYETRGAMSGWMGGYTLFHET
jgi:hypothetical protein